MKNNLSSERIKEIEQAFNATFAKLIPFVRDTNLDEDCAEKYIPGLVIREPGYTDVSYKIGGMVTSHRYFILSNHMADFAEFDKDTNWGLCVAKRDAIYKVLGTHSIGGKMAIFLIHLPEETNLWKIIKESSVSLETNLLEKAIVQFERTYNLPPIFELTTKEWLERCAAPLGIDDAGNLFPLEVD
ncbi:MAG: hypothetical protein E7429_03415 [Ruminococcaceae bacterium]|nr:hypothetical protein [Oscillospiraceae bacterium]